MKLLGYGLSLGLFLSLASCAQYAPDFHYNSLSLKTDERARINEEVENRFFNLAEHQVVPKNILLGDNAFPPGLEYRDSTISILKSYHHEILGSFKCGYSSVLRLMDDQAELDAVYQGIAAAGGDYGQMVGSTVWVIKLDPLVRKQLRKSSDKKGAPTLNDFDTIET